MEDDNASVASAVDESGDRKDKGKARASANEESLPTPKLGSHSSTIAPVPSPAESNIEESWGISPSIELTPSSELKDNDQKHVGSEGMPGTATKFSSPRNSSEEGTASSYDMVSATSADPPGSPKEPKTKKQNDDDDEDSDWA